MMEQHVTAHHLQRLAYLYVRQSTLHQVFENTESTARQYALRERATALGWPSDRIVVIDQDLGHSGASTADRLGFQRLVAEVGLGKVGLVLGLEVSRLARSSRDWHHLLEICALTQTLILDEDGLYNPASFNDRLLLGLKGTMSEAELYILTHDQINIMSSAKLAMRGRSNATTNEIGNAQSVTGCCGPCRNRKKIYWRVTHGRFLCKKITELGSCCATNTLDSQCNAKLAWCCSRIAATKARQCQRIGGAIKCCCLSKAGERRHGTDCFNR